MTEPPLVAIAQKLEEAGDAQSARILRALHEHAMQARLIAIGAEIAGPSRLTRAILMKLFGFTGGAHVNPNG